MSHAEIDHLRETTGIDQHVPRFQITVVDATGMSGGHRLADIAEQPDPLVEGKIVASRMVRDRQSARDVFHHEIRQLRAPEISDPRRIDSADPRVTDPAENRHLADESLGV